MHRVNRKELDGVTKATVNLALNTAKVEYVPTLVGVAQMKAAVSDAGYQAHEQVQGGASALDREREARQKEIRRQGLYLAFGTPVALLIMIGKDTALAQIIQLVEDAQASKAPIQKLADWVAGHFILGVHILALLVFVTWFFAGYQLFFDPNTGFILSPMMLGEMGAAPFLYRHNALGHFIREEANEGLIGATRRVAPVQSGPGVRSHYLRRTPGRGARWD